MSSEMTLTMELMLCHCRTSIFAVVSRSTGFTILSVVSFVTHCCFPHDFWPDGHYATPFLQKLQVWQDFVMFLVCVDTTCLTRTFTALACEIFCPIDITINSL